jgi:formylglycine-generating enzyme required for sulfatase activity
MEDEPLHRVRFQKGFWLGRFPVTQSEFKAVTRRSPSTFGRRRIRDSEVDVGRFPVETVSCIEAEAVVLLLNRRLAEVAQGRAYRLPTEAEWEYACRGGISNRYAFHYGASLEHHQANFASRHPYPPSKGEQDVPMLARPCEVGRYRPNAWGLYDMHGNVDEWCQDWYDGGYYLEGSPEVDPPGPDNGYTRVLRGGSWRGQGEDCRAAVRIGYDPLQRFSHVGFRLVCEGEALT